MEGQRPFQKLTVIQSCLPAFLPSLVPSFLVPSFSPDLFSSFSLRQIIFHLHQPYFPFRLYLNLFSYFIKISCFPQTFTSPPSLPQSSFDIGPSPLQEVTASEWTRKCYASLLIHEHEIIYFGHQFYRNIGFLTSNSRLKAI